MFDYEILCYKIEYKEKGDPMWSETTKGSEEAVSAFLSSKAEDIENYRILQIRQAIAN